MELSEWQEVIGNVTGLFAIIQFLTGIPVNILSNKDEK